MDDNDLANYADDNIRCISDNNINEIISTIEKSENLRTS